mgnify:CR=1 FL=1
MFLLLCCGVDFPSFESLLLFKLLDLLSKIGFLVAVVERVLLFFMHRCWLLTDSSLYLASEWLDVVLLLAVWKLLLDLFYFIYNKGLVAARVVVVGWRSVVVSKFYHTNQFFYILSHQKFTSRLEVPDFGETFIELLLFHNRCGASVVEAHLLGIVKILISVHTSTVGMFRNWT